MGANSILQIFGPNFKNWLFKFWSYFAIFAYIIWRFEARDVSNDRELFSLQKSSDSIIFWVLFVWERGQNRENKSCNFGHEFQYHGRNYSQSTRSQTEILTCCSPDDDAFFGVFSFEKFDQEMIKFFFTKSGICYDFI